MATTKTTAKSKLVPAKSAEGYESSTSEKKLHQRMVSFRQELAKDPEAARNFLASAGITTPKGRLRKIFGG